MSEGPLTYADLATRWGISPRQVRRICRSISLKPMRLGHRTVRFRPADVDTAEESSTKIKAKGKGRKAA